MVKIIDYIVETIVFAHLLPVSREYAAIAFIGRKPKAAYNRLVLALLKSEGDGFSMLDEASLPSCTMIRANAEVMLAAEHVNLDFTFGDAGTITVSYTDHDFFGEDDDVSESFTFRVQDFQ